VPCNQILDEAGPCSLRRDQTQKKSAMLPNMSGHAYPKQGHAASAVHKREKNKSERHARAKQCHAKSSQ